MIRERTNLVLGRGEVYFDEGDGERYLGNTPSFQIIREIERLERATAYRGRREQQAGAVISETIDIRLTTDNMSQENVDMWFSSNSDSSAVGHETNAFSETLTVTRGRFYQVGKALVPGGVRFIDWLEATVDETPLVEGEDYYFERTLGRIQITVGAPRISDGDSVSIVYGKRPTANVVTQSQPVDKLGALRYVARNPHGPRGTDIWFPHVRLSPRGAIEMKGDQFRQMQFDASAIRLGPNEALAYAITSNDGPIPITADTTLTTADTTVVTTDNDAWDSEDTNA